MRGSVRLAALAGAALAIGGTLGVASYADGPGPDASQCGGGSAPAGSPVGSGGAVLVLASNTGGTAMTNAPACSYVFEGTSAPQYSAATPNTWTITATHTYSATPDPVTGAPTCTTGDTLGTDNVTCTHTDASASGGDINAGGSPVTTNGSLVGTLPGDTVTITATYGCVSGDPSGGDACGGAGFIAVGNPV